MGLSNDLVEALEITVEVGGVWAIVARAKQKVETGIATPAEKKLIEGFNEVIVELKIKGELEKMTKEAIALAEQQKKFKDKWAKYLPPGKE